MTSAVENVSALKEKTQNGWVCDKVWNSVCTTLEIDAWLCVAFLAVPEE